MCVLSVFQVTSLSLILSLSISHPPVILCSSLPIFLLPTIRPVVSEGQYNKIWAYIDEAKELGYSFLYGGDRNMVTVESGNVMRNKVS